MDSNALIAIEDAVTRYLLKYKKPNDDYATYLEHACNLLRDFHLYDSQEARTEKLSVDSLGIIEMPADMLRLKGVSVARNGEWWTFTERPAMVNTTTTTGDTEGHDSDFGEGVSLKDGVTTTYGARGGINAYYYTIDWNARRIFCDGITSDTVAVKYISSGVSVTGTTYMPDLLTEVLDNYLLFKESYWISGIKGERPSRQRDYYDARMKVRNLLNSLTASQWKDLLWGSFTQSPKR